MIPVNEQGWHAGGNYWGTSDSATKVSMGWISDCSNSTGIGIETATPGFPATDTFSGEMWDSDEMYEWYAGTYDYTATYLAQLVASLCIRLNFNPYTQVAQHYSSAGKNCPIQMRYVFGSGGKTFTFYGTYFKVMLNRMYDYYEAYGGTYKSTDTVKNTYYNPSKTVYKKGLYKSGSTITVYRAGNTSTGSVGTVAAGNVVDVQTVGFDWGRVVLANGTVGWVKLSGLTYVGNTYKLGTYRTSSGSIVNVTNISGTTAYYSGGSTAISNLTKVYKVTINGDKTFGSTAQYVADGTVINLSAAGSDGHSFDIWELTTGYAKFDDKKSANTTLTVSGSDIVVTATYRDEYDLLITYGTGAGSYKPGTVVNIKATGRAGYAFVKWEIVSGSGTFGNVNSANTTFTTTASATTIKATYESVGALNPGSYTNYASGKSYTTTWKGASSFDYYSTTQNDSTSLKKLTNGVKASGSFSNTQSIYASFIGTAGTAVFTIDLGQNRNICMIALCDIAEYSSFGDIDSASIKVEVSTNGSTYTSVQSLTDTLLFSYTGSTRIDSLYTHRLDFVPDVARYVRISFTSAKYVTSLSEIEVYGSASIATYNVTVNNGTGGGAYAAGKIIGITANAPAEGYEFAGWTLTSGSGTIGNPTALSTTFTVGTSNAVLTANYKQTAKLELTDAAVSGGVSVDNGVVKGVAAKQTAAQIAAMFKYGVTITNAKGEAVDSTTPVGTGATVSCNGESVQLVVLGDVDGDANVNATDYVAVKNFMKSQIVLNGVFSTACDFDGNGTVGAIDVIAFSVKLKN